MNWKNLLESVSESVNDELRHRHDYLVAENRILRNQIGGRVQFTDSERKELAEIGAKLGKQALAEIATVAQANPILAWHRKFTNQTVNSSAPPKSVGRPRVVPEIEEWVVRMARENRSWGYDRIQGSLKHLGYTISDQTVGNLLKRHGIPPAPERRKTVTWGEFVRPHLAVLLATDFFNRDIWSWFRLMISYLLGLLHFCGHQVPFVVPVLQRLMQGIRSFVLQCRDLRLPVQREIYKGKPRFPVMSYGDAVRRIPVSDLVFSDEGSIPSQDEGNVLYVSAVPPRPIRDGPIRRAPPCNALWPVAYCKAT